METIRHWALTFCIACMLAGIVRLLVPEKGAAAVIKTVLALYILLAVVSPVPKTDWSGMWKQLIQVPHTAPEPVFDTGTLTEQQLEKSLTENLQKLLYQNGVDASVAVNSKTDPAGIPQIANVQIASNDAGQEAKAEQLLRQYLGQEIPIENTAKDVLQ